MGKKIFVLGDSRTGTTSLSRLFSDYGFKSVHDYQDDVEMVASMQGSTTVEYRHARYFIEKSGYDAFSDYPTRLYFRELRQDYPDAYFILSVRKDLATWERSMRGHFSHRPDIIERIPRLAELHVQANDKIRQHFSHADNFIEICVDDGDEVNSARIAKFLGRKEVLPMKKLNATK